MNVHTTPTRGIDDAATRIYTYTHPPFRTCCTTSSMKMHVVRWQWHTTQRTRFQVKALECVDFLTHRPLTDSVWWILDWSQCLHAWSVWIYTNMECLSQGMLHSWGLDGIRGLAGPSIFLPGNCIVERASLSWLMGWNLRQEVKPFPDLARQISNKCLLQFFDAMGMLGACTIDQDGKERR